MQVTTPPRSLHSLIYVSSAVELFSTAELVTLLETCHRNNTRNGVTGMLLYKDGNFMQALEGEEAAVCAVHAKIQHDPRHSGLITLLEATVPERQFSRWSMGFRNLSEPEVRGVPGYNEFLNVPLDDRSFTANPSRASRLLMMFKQKM